MAYTYTTTQRTYFIKPGMRRAGVAQPWIDTTIVDFVDRSNTRTGQRVTHWKQKVKAGFQAGSAYYRSVHTVHEQEPVAVDISTRHSVSGASRYDIICKGNPFMNQTISSLAQPFSADNQALKKIHDRLRQVRSEMNGQLFFGELREAVRMIRNPAQGLVRFFTKYAGTSRRLRTNLQNSKRSADYIGKAVADLWLESQYGWKPFVSDIESAAKTASRILYGNAERRTRVSAKSESQAILTDTQFPSYDSQSGLPSGGAPIFPRIQMIRERKSAVGVSYIVGLRSTMDGPADSLSRVAELSGFTLENFVPTVYNLIPYSFLVDYFSNLGTIIESSFTDQSNVAWVVKTSRSQDSVVLNFQYDAKLTAFNVAAQSYILEKCTVRNGYSREVRTTLDRQLLASIPIPSLELTIPGADSLKWANMFALFRSSSRGLYVGQSRGR